MITSQPRAFGLIVIGDELLLGDREDRHLPFFRQLLKERGDLLKRCWILPDEFEELTHQLRLSLDQALPTFVCGGIGATPDDLTRGCAAAAAGVGLVRHPEAAALIEGRFGEAAYPERIHMADLPAGSRLIPNLYNQIAGFSLGEHHFLPGFPEMAWPMARWVLESHYPRLDETPARPSREASLRVVDASENELIPVMRELSVRFPGLKMFSLPHLGETRYVELGFRGQGELQLALAALRQALDARSIDYR